MDDTHFQSLVQGEINRLNCACADSVSYENKRTYIKPVCNKVKFITKFKLWITSISKKK
jgi:hypothetical protein